jgi:hypothetical protein
MLEVTLYFACVEEKPPLPLMVAVVPSTRRPIRAFVFKGIPHVALMVAAFEEKETALACANLVAEALALPAFDYSKPDKLSPEPLNNPYTS